MSKNIWVTGNGFDLYHGLRTGFRDFIGRVEEAFQKERDERGDLDMTLTGRCNVNGFFRHFYFMMGEETSWTFFEREMTRILEALERFCDVVWESQKDPEFDLISYNIIPGLFTYSELQIFKHFARIFEQTIDDPAGGVFKLRQPFITEDRLLNENAVITEVKRELDDFTRALDMYLAACASVRDCTEARIPWLKENPPDYVINFNYTDTVRIYGVPENRIYFAAGRADCGPIGIVLGSPDESEECGEWICMRKYYQKLIKFIGLPDREMLHPAGDGEEPEDVTVSYFGYSFPEGDAILLRELWSAAHKTRVICMDPEDYAQKVLALILLFGREEITEAVYDEKLVFDFMI